MECGLIGLAVALYKKIDCKRCGRLTQFAFKGSLGFCSYEINAQCRMNSETGGILGIFGFLVSMAGAIYTAINHKKIRCRCCGKDLDVSVDVDSTEEIKKKTTEEEESKAKVEAEEQTEVDIRYEKIETQRRGSIHDDDREVERKHYRKTRVVPLRPPPSPPQELE